jgi:hypothetical protein
MYQRDPQFAKAYEYLYQSLDADLQVHGVADPAARQREILRQEKAFAETYIRAGQSPAAALYKLAQNRGFRPGGQAVIPNPALNPASRRLQQQAAAMQSMTSMTGAGGSPAEGLSVAAIVDMPEHAFNELIGKLGGLNSPKVKSMFGG